MKGTTATRKSVQGHERLVLARKCLNFKIVGIAR
jgi:hypothetical protein